MAGRGGMQQVAAAAGVAAGTGAAQLGLGYGLGVVVWPAVPGVDDSVWLGSLGWATWIAASSTVFGAVVAGRLPGGRNGPWRFVPALSAAIGALLTVALIALPARVTERPQTSSPPTVAAAYAIAGVLIGLVIAYWAVFSRPVAANLMVTAGYLWALAAAAIVVELTTGRESATYLTSWQFAEVGDGTRYGTIYWPSALLTLLAALLIGMVAVLPAVRRGHFGVGAATSGAVGPLLVAAAFLVLAPQLTGALGQLGSAYLIAPYAVLAGLAGSAFVVALGQRAAERRKRAHHRPAPPAATGTASVQADDEAGAPADGQRTGASTRARAPKQDAFGSARVRPEDEVTAELAPVRPADEATAEPRPVRSAEAATAEPRPVRSAEAATAERTRGRATPKAAAEGSRAGAAEQRPAGPAPEARPGVEADQQQATAAAPLPRRKRPTGGATAAEQAEGRSATGRPDVRSTVAAPPATPTVARINPPRDRS